jgi:hypothetical protein
MRRTFVGSIVARSRQVLKRIETLVSTKTPVAPIAGVTSTTDNEPAPGSAQVGPGAASEDPEPQPDRALASAARRRVREEADLREGEERGTVASAWTSR